MRPPTGMAKLVAMDGVWVKVAVLTAALTAGLIGTAATAQLSGETVQVKETEAAPALVLAAPLMPSSFSVPTPRFHEKSGRNHLADGAWSNARTPKTSSPTADVTDRLGGLVVCARSEGA